MQIPRTGIILAYMAALAQAGPFTEDQAAFDARADFRVQLCKASGQCTNMRYTQGQCSKESSRLIERYRVEEVAILTEIRCRELGRRVERQSQLR